MIVTISGADPSCDSVYFCGNSLGLQPKTTQAAVVEVMENWSHRCVPNVHGTQVLLLQTLMQRSDGIHGRIEPLDVYGGHFDPTDCSGCRGQGH